MRVLVTGLDGFVGGHLADFLARQKGVEVSGLECDIRDAAAVERRMARLRPDRIFHLAAQSFVPASWDDPAETLMVNTMGSLHLLEAVKKLGLKARVQVAGSSDQYGAVSPKNLPIREDCPMDALSPYGVSKVAQDLLAEQYFLHYKIAVVRTRAFSHIGPRQREDFAASNFARQIALAEAGKQEPVIRVGDLGTVRDFTDVRDMARAYWLALERGKPGEAYNIGSGRGRKISELLGILVSKSRVKIRVMKDPSRMRTSDIPRFVCDVRKFRKATGWKPEIPIERSLADILDHWRGRVNAS